MVKQEHIATADQYLPKDAYGSRLLSIMMDISIMISPMVIWNIIMLAILGSLLSINIVMAITIFVGILMLLTIFLLTPSIMLKAKGRSFGMLYYGFAVYRKNGKRAGSKLCVFREILGNSLPFVVLMVFTNFIGVGIYWLLNGIAFLVDKKHRMLIDFILGTYVNKVKKVPVAVPRPSEVPEPVHTMRKVYPRNRIDLRMHSTFSADGEYNVEELFQQAAKGGVHTISITDWNSVKSNVLAMAMQELYKVNYVPGVELGADYKGKRIRILGYFIDYQNDIYTALENNSLVNEKNASVERMRLFEKQLGRSLPLDRLLNNRFQRVSGKMIARFVMTDSAYEDCEILKPYRLLNLQKAVESIHKDYFIKGKPCYVRLKCPSLQDVLDIISLTDGISVLADGASLLQKPDLLSEVLDMGIDGIQVFQPEFDKKEMADLLKVAQERKLFITCGSGFTQSGKEIEIGDCHCPIEGEAMVTSLIRARM